MDCHIYGLCYWSLLLNITFAIQNVVFSIHGLFTGTHKRKPLHTDDWVKYHLRCIFTKLSSNIRKLIGLSWSSQKPDFCIIWWTKDLSYTESFKRIRLLIVYGKNCLQSILLNLHFFKHNEFFIYYRNVLQNAYCIIFCA